MEIKITKITVLINYSGTDEITLYTELPSAFPKWLNESAHLDLHVQRGLGVEYALKNFKMDVEIIDASTGEKYNIEYKK